MMAMSTASSRKIVVLSGGTAANSLVDVFNGLIAKNNCSLSYIIPISDNGGSSSELIRVFGGPGIGDIRSRFSTFHLSPNSASTYTSLIHHLYSPRYTSLTYPHTSSSKVVSSVSFHLPTPAFSISSITVSPPPLRLLPQTS